MANLGDVLYRKKTTSESDSETAYSEDVWDDAVLINFYDKALKVAQEQVAKRLAMSTNTLPDTLEKEDVDGTTFKMPTDSSVTSLKNIPVKKIKKKRAAFSQNDLNNLNDMNKHVWEVGDMCRATFSEDGVDYEATIEHILDKENCIVTYIGYENQDVVPLSSLEPSWGKYQRILQTQQANSETKKSDQVNISDSEKKLDNAMSTDHGRDYIPPSTTPRDKTNGFVPLAKSSKKKKSLRFTTSVKQDDVPSLPSFQFPPYEPSMNLHNMLPPPPMPFLGNFDSSSPAGDQALSKMLISWYMSGYYTGLYQGQRNAEGHSKRKSSHRM